MRHVAAVVAVALGATLAPTGCGDGAGGGARQAPSLRAELQRSTLFETQRALRLSVRLDGDDGRDEVELDSVQLDSPLFESVPPDRRAVPLAAGGRPVVLPLPLGPPRCDGVNGGGAGPAELVVAMGGDEVRVAIDENPDDVLASFHAVECASAAVTDAVEMRFGEHWARTGPRRITGELEMVQRHAGVKATIDRLDGNVIFAVATERSEPWLEVSDERPSARGSVVLDAARCDPHALIEYKRTFTLSAWVRLGEREPARVDIEAEGATRQAMEAVRQACLG